jgi:hypothetical protein
MVSKLQLAVMECCQRAIDNKESESVIDGLVNHYYEIKAGIGLHKSPQLYGAFPTDPYSHTPANKGAQQPGMTGQVKEDIVSRFGELGIRVKQGQLCFEPTMLKKSEFLTESKTVTCVNVNNKEIKLSLEPGSLLFTYCEVPVIYKLSNENSIVVLHQNGSIAKVNGLALNAVTSAEIFKRTGVVANVTVCVNEKMLR